AQIEPNTGWPVSSFSGGLVVQDNSATNRPAAVLRSVTRDRHRSKAHTHTGEYSQVSRPAAITVAKPRSWATSHCSISLVSVFASIVEALRKSSSGGGLKRVRLSSITWAAGWDPTERSP